ncbi:MAG: HEAT repeat domain-containing protein [Planctomycetes bacterium]|nr:HEAT repeat domain-containing protein [Planctomycetota bacterium]
MFVPLLVTACFLASPTDPATASTPAAAIRFAGEPEKALAAWLKLYRKGKIEIYSTKILNRVPLVVDWVPPAITAKQSFAIKFGVAPKGGLGDPTWLNDLECIAEALANENTGAAAEALLELVGIGLDGEEYKREMAPDVVRGVGEKWAAKLSSDEAREVVATAARGELKTTRALAIPTQAAALRALGSFADPKYRATIEPLLGHIEVLVRLSAAEALALIGDEKSALGLIGALENEQSEVVLPAIVKALRSVYSSYLPKLDTRKPGGEGKDEDKADKEKADKESGSPAKAAGKPSELPESSRLAARAALKALGRSSWRSDMALLRFLDDFRTPDSIPALIALLERYRANPDQVQSGALSTLVLHRAHELLVSMTGAVFPADAPEKWTDFWNREKDKLEVQKRHEPTGDAHTVASGFAGIPVQGSRVLFILDLSRSMTFAMTKNIGADKKGRAQEPSSRIDYARRELNTAIESLPKNASFNMITFDGDAKAKMWNKAMVPATDRNREKFKKFLSDIEPDGGTNLWSALEVGLKVKSMVYGDRYETNVDEIFILSDGAPSVGEVLDPIQILRLVKESNRFSQMRINTVFISSPNEEERRKPPEWMTITPEELMSRLATENGGKCVILKD